MKTLLLSALVGAFALAAYAGGEACATAAKNDAAPSCCPASKAKVETTKATTCPASKAELTAAKDGSCTATKTTVTKKQSPKATTLASK